MMIQLGVGILLLAGLGVACGVVQLLDVFGVVDLDEPEYRHIEEELDEEL